MPPDSTQDSTGGAQLGEASRDVNEKRLEEPRAQESYHQPSVQSGEDTDVDSSELDYSEPPDGGLMAWSMCICAHILLANTWGVMNSFGVFQAYYTDHLGISAFKISWIGSLQSFLGFFVSLISGPMSDAGYFRLTLALGTALLLFGAFAMSFSTQYWQLMLSQGVAFGTGVGFLCCPMMSVTSTYFSKRRSLAFGIVTSGNATGGLIYPAMARQLLPSLGFGWALRAIAFTQAATMMIVLLVAKARVKPKRSGIVVNLSSVDVQFGCYCLSAFFAYAGTFTILYYMAEFARSGISPELSYQNSLNLLLIFNGVSLFGRLIPSWLADRMGNINLLVPTVFWGGISCLGWIWVQSPAGMYAWTVMYAFAGGALLTLFPAGAASLSDMHTVGERIGILFTVEGLSMLAGPPVAGAILTKTGHYEGAQAYAAVFLLMGSMLILAIKVWRKRLGEKWTERV